MIRVSAVAIDAKPVQRRDAHRDREIPVRSTADSCCAFELEADLLCNGSSLVEHEVDCTPAHERRPRDLARHARLDVGSRRFQSLDSGFHLVCRLLLEKKKICPTRHPENVPTGPTPPNSSAHTRAS